MRKTNNIAIDGHSSCGKGTLAKYLAHKLNFLVLDTGAMYRAVTYAVIKSNIPLSHHEKIDQLLHSGAIQMTIKEKHLDIKFKGRDISEEIRMPEVSNMVSQVSEIEQVRNYLVKLQRNLAKEGGIVMDGRDIGSHVLPDAALKIFMTADAKIRAKRRHTELLKKGVDISFEEVLSNIEFRDHTDANRKHNPLVIADDAQILDNSHLSIKEQNEIALDWALEALSEEGNNPIES